MRVLHVIPSVAPRYGGPSVAVVGYCRALASRRVEVLIATTNADGDGVLPVETDRITDWQGVPAIFFPRIGEGFKYSAPLARWTRAAVTSFDVVHVHAVFSHASLAAGRACRAAGVPYVVRPLGSLDPWSLTQSAWKKRLLLMTSARALVQHAAVLHFTTDEEQRLAAPVSGGVPGMVIPPGVDGAVLADPMVPVERRERRLVALTRLDPKKRLDELIRAFHAAASQADLVDWHLSIAGDGSADYRALLIQIAASGPAASRIDFPGWLDDDRKARLLRSSSLFALPSHQENFGIAVMEALACGVPAVVSRGVNLAADIETAGAGWVVGDGEDDLSAALARAMRDTAARARCATAARTLASRFTWAAAAEQLERQYALVAQLAKTRRNPAEARA